MDTHTPQNIPYLRRAVRMAVEIIFHLMAAVNGEFPASVSSNVSIYEFVGDVLAAAFHGLRMSLIPQIVIFLC